MIKILMDGRGFIKKFRKFKYGMYTELFTGDLKFSLNYKRC